VENSVVQRLTHPIIICGTIHRRLCMSSSCVSEGRKFWCNSVSSKLLYEFMYYMVKCNQKHTHISNSLKTNVCINCRQKFRPYLMENKVCVHYEVQSVMLYKEIKDIFVVDT
jgi:hypothetical protein